MAVNVKYGYRRGPQLIQRMKVDGNGTFPIEVGMILTLGTAGYVQIAGAGDNAVGWAASRLASDPGADGDASIDVDISELAVYEVPPDAGSVTQALVGKTCDVGAAAGGYPSADLDASTDDGLSIEGVDTDANTLFVRIVNKRAGVV